MSYFFSGKTLGFYAAHLKENYITAGTWPSDAVEIGEDDYLVFCSQPPTGKMLGSSESRPAWVDIPPPTQEEIIATAEARKQDLINQANKYMNGKQWPGKAAIGRLKEAELEAYDLWLDYLDMLDSVDASTAPDIEWPTMPA